MPAGIGAAGVVGVAFETVAGTYVAPTKYIPVRSEGLQFMKEINPTRPIIANAVEPVHAVNGPAHVEGDIEWEVIEDCLPYFFHAARMTVVKSGSTPNFVYTYSPAATAQEANKTLSITVVRNGAVFAYTGCVLAGFQLSVDNGMLVGTMRMMGRDEATQSAPSPTWPQTAPFGADTYTIEIPDATPITDAASFSIDVDDSAEAQFRLGSLAARYIGYGERNITVEIERDFIDKTQFAAFKALTSQSINLRAQKTAQRYVDILVNSAYMESYEATLEGQGEIITAALSFIAKYDFSLGKSYTIAVGTAEDIT